MSFSHDKSFKIEFSKAELHLSMSISSMRNKNLPLFRRASRSAIKAEYACRGEDYLLDLEQNEDNFHRYKYSQDSFLLNLMSDWIEIKGPVSITNLV